jgi:hypothetical protein
MMTSMASRLGAYGIVCLLTLSGFLTPAMAFFRAGGFGGFHAGGFGGFHGGAFGGFHAGGFGGDAWHGDAWHPGGWGGTWHTDGWHAGGYYAGGYHGPAVVNHYYGGAVGIALVGVVPQPRALSGLPPVRPSAPRRPRLIIRSAHWW